ncbi:DUF4355 domain-containing protein [Bacillus wiedmannii]|uniref:DUF4355 domain-containing protein n=1 Tax=Bacillus wiedmannii TaxID=1890302 RepID=UPI000BFC02FA|nr:DUF4355 domain-containing protein [Bacillus wiedmannii]PGZ95770.1 ribonuclease [Bacillus wiedmannii]
MKQLQKQAKVQFFKEKEATKLSYRLRLANIQFFAEGDGTDIGAGGTDDNTAGNLTGENPDGSNIQQNSQTEGGNQPKEPQLDPATKDFIEKMLQSREDKVRTKYAKELSATKKELENYKTASMTAQEKAEYEMKELQKTLEEREQVLHQKEMQSAAAEALSKVGLDIKFVDFVVGTDVDDTKVRVAKLGDLFNASLEAKVAERFKAAGRDIYAGSGNGATFTRQQVESMSQSEINENWTQIQKDMRTWGK